MYGLESLELRKKNICRMGMRGFSLAYASRRYKCTPEIKYRP